jgi:hypothetical protein
VIAANHEQFLDDELVAFFKKLPDNIVRDVKEFLLKITGINL